MKPSTFNLQPSTFNLQQLTLVNRYSKIFTLILFVITLFLQSCSNKDQFDTIPIFALQNQPNPESFNPTACPLANDQSIDYAPCSPDLNCTRTDLDPCDYANMRLYALAVMCELNKFVNGCPDQWDCSLCGEIEECFELATPGDFLTAHPYSSVWEYCSEADCSGEYVCPVGNRYTIHHWYLSVTDQNILIAYLRDQAALYHENCCIKDIELYAKFNAVTCASNNENFCTNYKIYAKVKYACNACD